MEAGAVGASVLDRRGDGGIRLVSLEVDEEVNLAPVVVDEFGGLRLDTRHVDLVASQNTEGLVEHARSLRQSHEDASSILHLPEVSAHLLSDPSVETLLSSSNVPDSLTLCSKCPILGLEASGTELRQLHRRRRQLEPPGRQGERSLSYEW